MDIDRQGMDSIPCSQCQSRALKKGVNTMNITLNDIPFSGNIIALHGGKVVWTNHESGDCPPDIALAQVINSYIVNKELVVELANVPTEHK